MTMVLSTELIASRTTCLPFPTLPTAFPISLFPLLLPFSQVDVACGTVVDTRLALIVLAVRVGMSHHMDAKLREAQLSLAEVIDEYLVLEQERDRLKDQCTSALTASHSLSLAIQSVNDYTSVMEAAVVSAMPQLKTTDRARIRRRGDAHPLDDVTFSPSEGLLFVAEVASQMQRIEDDVNNLLASLEAAQKQVTRITPAERSKGPHAGPSPSLQDTPESVQSTVQLRRDARLRATEMTVASLNTELASWQQRYSHLQEHSQRERETLAHDSLAQVTALREQLQESDAVLGRLSHELEVLIDENARLKQQLRSLGTS